MGRLTPNSTLKLYSNIFSSPSNNERPAWQSASAREAYFASHLVYNKTVQIVKKRVNTVKVSLRDITGVQLEACNYLSFQNPHYDNKLYYARIIGKDYGNDGMAYVTFDIDWWLTDMFKLDVSQSSIEREHMSQADATTAATNPYTGEILELRTAEPGLDVSRDLQKQVYNIGGVADSGTDGLYMMQAISDIGSQDYTNYLVMLSPIDFSALAEEGVTSSPATWFANLLNHLAGGNHSFYVDMNGSDIIGGTSFGGHKWSNKLPNPYYVLGFSSRDTLEQEYTLKNLLNKLTSWNCVSSILAIYGVPENHMRFFMYSGRTVEEADPVEVIYAVTGKKDLNGRSPKLACYPFSYLTVESPAGDVKEYQYEKFDNVRQGAEQERFYLIGDLAEKPRIAVVPKDYERTYTNRVQNPYGNFSQAVLFEQYATVAYVTDAWLAQIAAVSAQTIQGNTLEAYASRQIQRKSMQGERNMDIVGGVNGLLSADKSSIGLSDVAGVGANFLASEQSRQDRENMLYLKESEITGSYSAITGDYEGTALYDNMKLTRPAFVANEYHKGNGDGTILMNTAVNSDFIITRVRLADVVANQYDEYFKKFGYASGRIGIPRVIYYVDGYTDTSKLPDWQTTGDYKYTYIKTADAKIKCEDYEAEVAISAMFNKGVRIIKGDELQ